MKEKEEVNHRPLLKGNSLIATSHKPCCGPAGIKKQTEERNLESAVEDAELKKYYMRVFLSQDASGDIFF